MNEVVCRVSDKGGEWRRIGDGRLLALLFLPTTALYATYQGIQQLLIPMQVEALDPARKVENLALLTTLSGITAVLGILAGGAWSDRTRGRWGRRAPWLAASAVVSGAILLVMGHLSTLAAVAIAWSALWFTTNLYQAALTGVFPDRVPARLRGTGSSVLGVAIPIGALIGVNMAARISPQSEYVLLAVLLVATTVLFLAMAPEDAFYGEPDQSTRAAGVHGPRILLQRGRQFFRSFAAADFAYTFVSRALICLAYFGITGYQFYIVQDYVGVQALPNHDARLAVSILTTISMTMSMLSTGVAGWIADRLDRRKLFVGVSSLAMSAAMLLPALLTTWSAMMAFQVALGISFGTYLAVDLALMSLVLPNKQTEGRDMAILAVAMTGSALLAPVLAGMLISAFGYRALFVFGSVASLVGGIAVFRVKSVR